MANRNTYTGVPQLHFRNGSADGDARTHSMGDCWSRIHMVRRNKELVDLGDAGQVQIPE